MLSIAAPGEPGQPCHHERAHSVRQTLGRPCRPRGSGRHVAHLHRPSSGARGDEPAGVRRPAARRPQAVAGRVDRRHRRPQHAHARLGPGHPRSHLAHAGRNARRQHQGARRQGVFSVSRSAPGDRPCDRPRTGGDTPRDDGGLRRLAHQHARRVRGARVRHRHLRSRARARDAVPADEEGEVDAGAGRRRAAGGRHRQGHRARGDRKDRHRRRHRPRDRIRGRGHPRALDGRPHDGLQHGDRGGGARRHDRRRRQDDRVPARASLRAGRGALGSRGPRTGARSRATKGHGSTPS